MDMLENVADSAESLITALAIPIEIAHYTMVMSGVRKDWDPNKIRQQPFATWFFSLLCCFGGGMLLNFFTMKPVLMGFTNLQSVVLFSIVWWHIFYCPGDIYYSLTSWTPIALLVKLGKEMIRTKKIRKGVAIARVVYPDSLLVCVFLGMIPACGGGFVKASAVIFNKTWNNNSIKEFYFSPVTKLCVVFSLLYNLQLNNVLTISFNTVVLLQFATLYLVAVSTFMGKAIDPFSPVEKFLSSIFINYSAFGGNDDKISEKEPEKTVKKSEASSKKNRRKED